MDTMAVRFIGADTIDLIGSLHAVVADAATPPDLGFLLIPSLPDAPEI